jgi:TolB-like protein/Tfp pilus assembly protein PilF
MKRCPECRRDYYDETLLYCLDDGAHLVEGPAGDLPSESPTRLIPAADTKSVTQVSKRNWIIAAVIGVVVITVLGLGAYLYYGRSSAAQIDSIAVMPFVNESGNADLEYLSDGMAESLMNSLSQLPDLAVQARSSVFPYKGKDADARTIGKELGVQAVLNGRVVQRGDGLTLYLELVNAQTGTRIWGDQYSRKTSDLVALQSEIARDVSQKLKFKLSGEDDRKIAKNYTQNAEAYQLYLKGRYHWYKRTEGDFQKSEEYFRQAIALDPNYALAYTGLADLHAPTGGAFRQNLADRSEQLAKAREAALKAVSLDNGLAEAHTSLGTILVSADHDFVGAEREYLKAIELNPNYADAHYWYGMILNRTGRFEESFAELKRAMELEPFNLLYQALYCASLTWARRYEEGVDQLEKTQTLDENFLPTLGNLSTAYELNGNYGKAIETRARELELSRFAQDANTLRSVYSKGGWEGYLRYLTSNGRPAWASLYGVAVAYARLGERDKAIYFLYQSYEHREGGAQRLKVDPRLDPLRDDPRFKELLKKAGFPE